MGKRVPEHAKKFRGKAKNIPQREMRWLPYQWAWITDPAIMKLMEKSRRTGVSFADSYESSRYHSQRLSDQNSWVSSRDETTAKLYAKDAHKFSRALNIAAGDLGEQVLLDDKGNKVTVHTIPYANGTTLNSLASNPDVFAGKGGRVKLDEHALRNDPRGVYGIASPTIDWGGTLAIISTHRGSKNFFNTLIREIKEQGNPKRFSHHRVTLEDALDQHLLWKLQCVFPDGDPRLEMDEADYFEYQRKRAADEETFQQEYMCVPSDDAGAFLEYSLIDACTYKAGERWEYSIDQMAACSNPLFAGLDIGRTNDLTSLIILEKVGGHYFLRKRIDLQGEKFSLQESVIYPWIEHVQRVCIDKTGLGMQFAERMEERFGKYKAEGVTFTGPMKEELAYPVRTAFEDHGISIPFGDKVLESDLRAIRKETTAAGNVRFAADRGEDGHADRFWSLALAIHAGQTKQSTFRGGLC